MLTPPSAETVSAPEEKPKAKKVRKEKAEKPAKDTAGTRSNLAKQYPDDAKLTILVDENPKRPGSKAHARFELYKNAATVGEYLAATAEFDGKEIKGTYTDIAYNGGRGYIQVG